MPQLKKADKADLIRRYLDREGVDDVPLQLDLDRLFDDPTIRQRFGEVITQAVLGRHLH